jgi:hypothetical protein
VGNLHRATTDRQYCFWKVQVSSSDIRDLNDPTGDGGTYREAMIAIIPETF